MLHPLSHSALVFYLLAAVVGAQTVAYQVPDDVSFRKDDIISEGVRMAAEVFAPVGASEELPTIIMSHGWGGIAQHLRRDAALFAQSGFLVVTFDYRGWGASDSRLVLTGSKSTKDGVILAEVRDTYVGEAVQQAAEGE